MAEIMKVFRNSTSYIAMRKVVRKEDYLLGLNGLPKSDVLKVFYENEYECGSVVVRPSGTEPKLKIYISVMAESLVKARKAEEQISKDLKKVLSNK